MKLKRTQFCASPEPRVQEKENLLLMVFIPFPSSQLAQGLPNIYSCFSLSPFTRPPLLTSVSSFPPPTLVAADWKWEESVSGLRKVPENSGKMADQALTLIKICREVIYQFNEIKTKLMFHKKQNHASLVSQAFFTPARGSWAGGNHYGMDFLGASIVQFGFEVRLL